MPYCTKYNETCYRRKRAEPLRTKMNFKKATSLKLYNQKSSAAEETD
jgi:hypothetical protein